VFVWWLSVAKPTIYIWGIGGFHFIPPPYALINGCLDKILNEYEQNATESWLNI
jgi:hypothetical protein